MRGVFCEVVMARAHAYCLDKLALKMATFKKLKPGTSQSLQAHIAVKTNLYPLYRTAFRRFAARTTPGEAC